MDRIPNVISVSLFLALNLLLFSPFAYGQALDKDRSHHPAVIGPVVAGSEFAGNDAAGVQEFVRKQIDALDGVLQICSFVYAIVENNDKPVLIATMGNGRFCNRLAIVVKSSSQFLTQLIPVWNGEKAADFIYGLTGDGKLQLVVPQPWSDYNGVNCIATWTRIYRVNPAGLIDVSSAFPSFYQSQLTYLQSRLKTENEPSCDMMIAARIQRTFGINSGAEFSLAQEWKISTTSALRSKAIDMFADVGDRVSILELRNISLGDHDPLVRAKAAAVLNNIATK